MATIQNSTVYDLLPPSYQSIEAECTAYALKQAVGRFCAALSGVTDIFNIDEADEDMLDYLAAELGIFFYDQSDTAARKRAALKLGLEFYYQTAVTEKGFTDIMEFVYGECDYENLGASDEDKIGVFFLDVGESIFASERAFKRFVSILTRSKRAGSRCELGYHPPDGSITLAKLSSSLQAEIAKISVLEGEIENG